MIAIAIDGPAGAGKSTIARHVAGKLGYIYVDTGALYRAIGLYASRMGIPWDNEALLAPALEGLEIGLRYQDGSQRVFIGDEDVSEAIRSPEMSRAASAVSVLPPVRAFLLELQRDMARHNNVIMDGRDIGTVVLPGAQVKIFLTASPEARAERRYREHLKKGEDVPYETVLEDMRQRDYNDTHREIAPLRQAEGAILLDTSHCKPEESIALVLDVIGKRGIG